MAHKRIKIISCPAKLQFVKTIMNATGKSLLEAKNIADSVIKYNWHEEKYDYGTLLLNESSITPIEWEEIAENTPGLKWEYV